MSVLLNRTVFALLLLGTFPLSTTRPSPSPTIAITNVLANTRLWVTAYNLPAGLEFDARLGPYGRIDEEITVGTFASGRGGTFTLSLEIPPALRGQRQLTVWLRDRENGQTIASNWFYNDLTASATVPPTEHSLRSQTFTLSITDVVADTSVTLQTFHLPPNENFDVFMGAIGTRALHGVFVQSVFSGSGGAMFFTIPIPPAFQGKPQIAIRMQSAATDERGLPLYSAHNWFYNYDMQRPDLHHHFNGYPLISIVEVSPGENVRLALQNLPAGERFQVSIGSLITRGFNGLPVATFEGTGEETQILTITIPLEVAAEKVLALRLQSIDHPTYYAFVWFYNR